MVFRHGSGSRHVRSDSSLQVFQRREVPSGGHQSRSPIWDPVERGRSCRAFHGHLSHLVRRVSDSPELVYPQRIYVQPSRFVRSLGNSWSRSSSIWVRAQTFSETFRRRSQLSESHFVVLRHRFWKRLRPSTLQHEHGAESCSLGLPFDAHQPPVHPVDVGRWKVEKLFSVDGRSVARIHDGKPIETQLNFQRNVVT